MLLAQISHTYPATMCVQNCKKKSIQSTQCISHTQHILFERKGDRQVEISPLFSSSFFLCNFTTHVTHNIYHTHNVLQTGRSSSRVFQECPSQSRTPRVWVCVRVCMWCVCVCLSVCVCVYTPRLGVNVYVGVV